MSRGDGAEQDRPGTCDGACLIWSCTSAMRNINCHANEVGAAAKGTSSTTPGTAALWRRQRASSRVGWDAKETGRRRSVLLAFPSTVLTHWVSLRPRHRFGGLGPGVGGSAAERRSGSNGQPGAHPQDVENTVDSRK